MHLIILGRMISELLNVLLVIGWAHACSVWAVVVSFKTDTPLDFGEALLLARRHANGAEDLIHLLQGKTFGFWAKEPYEQASSKRECLRIRNALASED